MHYYFYIIEQDAGGDPPIITTYLLTQGEQEKQIEDRLKHMIGNARIKHVVEIGALFDVRNLTVIAHGGQEHVVKAAPTRIDRLSSEIWRNFGKDNESL